MAKAIKRLTTELKDIIKAPPPLADARPDEANIRRWVFVLEGAPDTPYEGGEYLGELLFPEQYPFKPPSIKMLTPSGRFRINTRLCFSMSDFHPEDWSPMWGVQQILVGLTSFMSEEAATYGSITTSVEAKRQFAADSHSHNLALTEYQKLFPGRYAAALQRVEDQRAAAEARLARRQRQQLHTSGGDGDADECGGSSSLGVAAANAGLVAFVANRFRGLCSSWAGVVVLASASVVLAATLSASSQPGGAVGPATDMVSPSAGAALS